jgi:type IV fimbrial biogenesis protein FimT
MRARGFTMIEVLMVLAILAVLASLTAPAMRDFIDAQVIKNPASDLYSSLVLARSEAIKRNAPVDLEPAASDWAQGWQVKVPSDGKVLRDQQAYQSVSVLASTVGKITYGGNGRLATSATNFRVMAPGNTRVRMRCVTVDASGRPNVRIDSDTNQTACN